jgi:hypothetical protein
MKPTLPTAPKTLRILKVLRGTLFGLTVAQALKVHDVYALSQEIGRLRKLGWKIDSVFVKTSGGARVKRYWIA